MKKIRPKVLTPELKIKNPNINTHDLYLNSNRSQENVYNLNLKNKKKIKISINSYWIKKRFKMNSKLTLKQLQYQIWQN
jgi:hypothetical protein